MQPNKIMIHYVKYGAFLLNFFGSFPTDIMFIITWDENTVLREVTSLICGFRVFSLSSYLSIIADAYNAQSASFHVYTMIFWIIIAFHWETCLYWLVPIGSTSMHLLVKPNETFWIHELHLWEASPGSQYLHCLIRTISTSLLSGFLRIKPTNVPDITLVIILQIIGCVGFWILLARVNQLYRSNMSSEIKYQDMMEQVKENMKYKQLPIVTQNRIKAYYEFCFQNRYFYESEILNTLSPGMRQEIGMHVCRKLVENVTFFNNLPLLLLTRIVTLLKSEIFLPNDVIVRVNQSGDCMYFIATGTVAIYTASGKEVCHLEDGAHFGEIALVMPDERRVASVVAVEICELYRLDRIDFARTIHPYPMLWEQIKKIAIERHERTTILNMQ